MQSFTTSDNVVLKYLDTGIKNGGDDLKKPWLILIHGFTGSSLAWTRNIPSLSKVYRVIAPDLRGHGESDKPDPSAEDSATVERLALDLRELVGVLAAEESKGVEELRCRVVGGSLGCAVIWTYATLFTTTTFTHTIFIDQSPLQNALPDWQPPFCHKGLNSASDLALFQKTITENPTEAHLGTIHSCLGYLSHPSSPLAEIEKTEQYKNDKTFFLTEALKGKSDFYSALMTDHTALDHRANIRAKYGPGSGSSAKVLVVASSKSGCFEPEGVLSVVDFVNGTEGEDGKKLARGVTVEWGGHWCYWEEPERFDSLALEFLTES